MNDGLRARVAAWRMRARPDFAVVLVAHLCPAVVTSVFAAAVAPQAIASAPAQVVPSAGIGSAAPSSPALAPSPVVRAIAPLGDRSGSRSLRVTEYRLTWESASQYDPAISGMDVVFTQVEGTGEIFRVTIPPQGPQPLVTGPGNQFEPDLSGSSVAYTNDVTGLQDIWFFDWVTQENYKVSASFMPDYEPAISGGNVVYTSQQSFNDDIYWFSLSTGYELPIATTSNTERYPAIDGELVAWVAFEGSNANIYARYLEQPTFPVATTASEENFPSVAGDLIAYRLGTDVAVFDASTGLTTRVTEDGYIQNAVKIAGTYVFFSDNRTGNFDIFMHDLATGLTYQLTDDPSDQNLTDADANRAVYYDSRYGNNDIFAVELTWNQPPIADAGDDQNVYTGEIAQLDGTGSSDPDGDPILDYLWTFESRPSGSEAALDDPHSATPTFTPDLVGDYILSLVVSDGEYWSEPDFVVLTATSNNQAPVADAGPDQQVEVGEVAHLDGTGSWDPDSDPIVGWSWAIDVAPPGSTAGLVGANTATPTLTPDFVGSYVVSLMVYDGEDWSAPDWVTIQAEPANLPPVADAGPDQQVVVGETVYLSGSGYDPEGQPIVGWRWVFQGQPPGSMALLDDPFSRTPTFVPDVAGVYYLSLIVSDGVHWSEPDAMTVTAALPQNHPPVADAGEDQVVAMDDLVQLDGTGSSDPDGDPIAAYRWRLYERPPGSLAALSDTTSATPTFLADVLGEYRAWLEVFDGEYWSAPDTVLVLAEEGNLPPIANAGQDQTVNVDDLVQLDGSGSFDPDADPIVGWRWQFDAKPLGSAAALSDSSLVNPTFTADLAGDYALSLVVFDGELWSLPDQVVVTATGESGVAGGAIPARFALLVIGPNPTAGRTTLRLDLPGGVASAGIATVGAVWGAATGASVGVAAGAVPVEVAVHDAAGRRVGRLAVGDLPPGSHLLTWDGRTNGGARVATGAYFIRARAGARTASAGVTITK